jgi:hypothetical protein
MILSKIMPARSEAKPVYANLDKLSKEVLRFELHGKIHELQPITVEVFYGLTNALVAFNAKVEGETADQVIDKCTRLFQSVCSTITREDVEKMTKMQVGALYALITEHAVGRSHEMTSEDLKKKVLNLLT